MSSTKYYAPSFRIVVGTVDLEHGRTVDVLSVKVTDTIDRADSFSFTLRDRHPEHQRLFAGGPRLQWMDSDAFNAGTEVEIFMGYVDDLRCVLIGRIKAVSANFPASGQPTLQVEGYSLYHDLQHCHRRKPFKSTTDSGIATEIAKAMGLKADVDKTKAEHPLYSPNGASYAAILEKRAKRIGYEVSVKERTLFFKKPRYRDNTSPDLTLEWGRDLRSFSPRISAHDMVPKVTVRASQTTLGGDKKPLVGEAKAGQERGALGKETGSQVAKRIYCQASDKNSDKKENTVLINDHTVVSQTEAEEVALAQLESRSLGFITGRGAVIGEPKLLARSIVELKGLGKLFSGKYYVTSATHTINASGYLTDFEVKRNAK